MKKLFYLLTIIILLQVDTFAYAKKIVLASIKNEKRADLFSKQVIKVIEKDKKLSQIFKINNISVSKNKINKYNVISIKVFQDKKILLKTLKIIRKKYKDAYIQDTLAPISKKSTLPIKKIIKKDNKKKKEVKKIKTKEVKTKEKVVKLQEKKKTLKKEKVSEDIKNKDATKIKSTQESLTNILSSIDIVMIILFIIFIIIIYYALKFKRIYDEY